MSYFQRANSSPEHPRIRHWRQLLPSHPGVSVELYRPWDGIVRRPPRLFLKLGERILDEVPWEVELDRWLVTQKIKAVSEENEADRFGLLMIQAMKPIEREFGDDYAMAVLCIQIHKGPYAQEPSIQEVLPPYRDTISASPYAARCDADIRSMLEGFASQLTGLYADEATAERILVLAIGQFLGEKYHVTERRRLGWR